MNYIYFTFLHVVLFFIVLLVLQFKDVEINKVFTTAVLILIVTGIPTYFNLNCKKGDLKYSYNLINMNEANYFALTGNRSTRPAVMYLDSDSKLHVRYIDTCKLNNDDGKSRIDFYEYGCGFLKGMKSEIYVNDLLDVK